MKVIIDFDGTLTVEEAQAVPLAAKMLDSLAGEILQIPRDELTAAYQAARSRIKAAPQNYAWMVNGLAASYADEGAFILNTTSLQVMLRENESFLNTLTAVFPDPEYDVVTDTMNYLFHRHSAELKPVFRPAAEAVLNSLFAHPERTPIILTNSLADKVKDHLSVLSLSEEIDVLGDTRQFAMAPDWTQTFNLDKGEAVQVWPVLGGYQVDLRRPAYYQALIQARLEDPSLVVVADTFSMPGALPLVLGIPFMLLKTSYTPDWSLQAVENIPGATVLPDLAALPEMLAEI